MYIIAGCRGELVMRTSNTTTTSPSQTQTLVAAEEGGWKGGEEASNGWCGQRNGQRSTFFA